MKNLKRLFLVIGLVLVFSFGLNAKGEIKLWIDGEYVVGDVSPTIVNDRTLVPLRMISEKLGIKPIWNEAQKTITLNKEEKVIVFKVGDSNYILQGENKTLDVAPQIISDRTFVPLRVIAEVFGKNVDWDATNKTAIVGDGYVTPVKEASDSPYERATVKSVVDGDTVVVLLNGEEKKVRFVGVDAPEMSTPNGPMAKNFTEKYLTGKEIYLEKDVSETDKYDRLLRYIWLVDPTNIKIDDAYVKTNMYNAIMIMNGMAASKRYNPDVKYQDLFDKLNVDAVLRKVGMWTPMPEGITVTTNKIEGWGLQFGTFVPENRTKVEEKQNGKVYFADTTKGVIKGNASSKKYHLEGMQGYDKISVINVCFFKTEKEAIERGFVKAKR